MSFSILSRILLAVSALITLVLPAGAQTILVSPSTLSFYHQLGQGSPVQQNLAISASTALATTVTTSSLGGVNWLFANPIVGTTPYTMTVVVAPSGLTAGVYNGTIAIASQGATNSPVMVPVTLTVSNSPLLVANPTALTYSFSAGGTPPPSQQIALSSTTTGVAFTAAASVGWLSVTPVSGNTSASLTVTVNQSGLPIGLHTGSVTVAAAAAGNSPLVIPVAFTVADEIRLTVSPATLAVDFQAGTAQPADRVVSVISTGAPANFTAVATTTSGGSWLSLGANSGNTPANLSIGFNPTGLAAGTYAGKISVSSTAAINSPQEVAVTLKVTTDPILTAGPAGLHFTSQTGGASVPRQIAVLSNFGNTVPFTLAVSTNGGGDWLSALPSAATTPAALSIGVNPGSLLPGTYTGAVTVTGTAGNSPFAIPVTLVVTPTSALRVTPNQLSFVFQTGGSNPASKTLSIASTGLTVNYNTSVSVSGGGAWLAVTPATGAASSEVAVTANPAGLSPGLYTGTVNITSTEANSVAVPVPVTLLVSATSLLNVPSGPLTYSFAAGGTPPVSQNFLIASTGAAFNFSAATTTTTASNWLVIAPASGPTGTLLSVGVNPLGLSEGTFTGIVTITAAGVLNSPQHIPVSFTVSTASELIVGPAPLVFDQVIGADPIAPKTLNVSSSGTILSFNATAATTLSGGTWLSVTPSAGLTPAAVSVRANAAGLEAGTYAGSISVTAANATNSPRIVPVTLNVTRARPELNVSRSSLTFNANASGSAPAGEQIQVTSSGDPLSYVVSVTTSQGTGWLSVTSASGTTPASFTVNVSPANLAPGNYNGTVSVASTGASNSPRNISVSFTLVAVTAPSLTAFVNAASFLPAAAVPGMIVTLGGVGIGPTTISTLQLKSNGTVETKLADTRILFDGIESPLVYVSSTQSSAVVPYAVSGRLSSRVQVEYKGVLSNALQLNVADASPGIFTANSAGSGQGSILNQNGSVNSTANPADRGFVIVVYATGEGQTMPAGTDGSIAGATLKRPLLQVLAKIGGQDAVVEYAGSAPGLISGAFQVNLRVPDGVIPGPAVPVEITVGAATTQVGVTVAIR
ncbi:MAG: hypothetical protein JJE04_11165 [Acidobacteriia bacterium]|nr:hypothetical protein [Terriglobia bacterium]